MLKTVLAARSIRVMLLILTIIAVATAMYYAKPVLAPALFAMVVGIVISPLADRLDKMGIARVVVAGSLLVISTLILVVVFLSLEPLISGFAAQMPVIKRELRGWVNELSGVLRGIEAISSEIEETVGAGKRATEEMAEGIPTLMDALWLAPNFGAQMFIFIGTLFFFVLTRNELYERAGALRTRFFRAERAVARYFAAVTVVNSGLGLATGIAMAAIGLEGAWIWGLAAGMLNFILYLGPLIIMAGLAVAGLTQLGGAAALLPPLCFMMINLTEAQFVTPAFVGRQLHLNPLIVFLAIVFGLWIWGPVGAIVALPVLLWTGRMLAPDDEITPGSARRPAAAS